MTFEELLKSCSAGTLPSVEYKGKTGKVTTIKIQESGWRGCAVKFDDVPYDTWFHAISDTDKRSRYMSDLKLIQS